MVPGWPDPVLAAALGAGSPAAHVRLAFAWPSATSPMQAFNKTPAELSHKDDLLIFERNISTGKTAQLSIPLQARRPTCLSATLPFRRSLCSPSMRVYAVSTHQAYGLLPHAQALSNAGHSSVFVLHTAPTADQPLLAAGLDPAASAPQQAQQGSIAIRGADGGLDFGLDGILAAQQTVFDATFYRPVNTSFIGAEECVQLFQGRPQSCSGMHAGLGQCMHGMVLLVVGDTLEVNGISLRRYELTPEALASCSNSPPPDLAHRCVYPDAYSGTWNASLTYGFPTLITLPHFYLVMNMTSVAYSPLIAVCLPGFTTSPKMHALSCVFVTCSGMRLVSLLHRQMRPLRPAQAAALLQTRISMHGALAWSPSRVSPSM